MAQQKKNGEKQQCDPFTSKIKAKWKYLNKGACSTPGSHFQRNSSTRARSAQSIQDTLETRLKSDTHGKYLEQCCGTGLRRDRFAEGKVCRGTGLQRVEVCYIIWRGGARLRRTYLKRGNVEDTRNVDKVWGTRLHGDTLAGGRTPASSDSPDPEWPSH